MSRILNLLAMCVMSLSMAACTSFVSPLNPPASGGRVDRTDYNAPKEIKSKDIESLSAHFYRYEPLDENLDGAYWFNLEKNEDGNLILSESNKQDISAQVDSSVLMMAQEIIDKHKLAQLNGVDTYVSGLPPEYQPISLSVKYKSGEELYFNIDGDPNAEWSYDLLKLFREQLAKNGKPELLPSKAAMTMTRFYLEYSVDGVLYQYSDIEVPKDEDDGYDNKYMKYVFRLPFGGDYGEEISEEFTDIPENFYDDIQKITAEYDVQAFHNGYTMPFEVNNILGDYYYVYAEYENGRIMSSLSQEKEYMERFEPAKEAYIKYLDSYFEQ